MKKKILSSLLIATSIFIASGCGVEDAIRKSLAQAIHVSKDAENNVTIPDNSSLGAISSINVSTDYSAVKIFSVEVEIKHQKIGDLKISLTSPHGTTVILSDRRGGNTHNMDITFDDNATDSITTATAPLSYYYIPEEALSNFNGQNPNGNWKLKVVDSSATKVGKIVKWSLITFEDRD